MKSTIPLSHLARARRGMGAYVCDDWEGYCYDDGSPDPTVVDPWIDNGDGSFTNPIDGSIWEGDQLVGYDNFDGTWWGTDGQLYGGDNTTIEPAPGFDATFEYDETTGLYFDTLTGGWYAIGPEGAAVFVTNNPDGPSFEELAAAQGIVRGETLVESPGIFAAIGGFLGKLFGGSSSSSGQGGGGGGFGGSSSSGSKQAADQRAQQAAQQLEQAQRQGANAQTIANLQRQLALAQSAAAAGGGGDWQKTILVAVAAGAVTYAIATARRNSPPPTDP